MANVNCFMKIFHIHSFIAGTYEECKKYQITCCSSFCDVKQREKNEMYLTFYEIISKCGINKIKIKKIITFLSISVSDASVSHKISSLLLYMNFQYECVSFYDRRR